MELRNVELTEVYSRNNAKKIQVFMVVAESVVNVSSIAAIKLGMRFDNKRKAVHVRGNIPLEMLKELIEA